MNAREKSFVYSLILILPMLWSFLTISDWNYLLRLYIIVPVMLTVMFFIFLLRKKNRFEIHFEKALSIFAIFSIYITVVSAFAGDILFALKLILVISTIFTFSFLGNDIKYYSYIGYIYAIIAAVIILDFNNDGLTSGWNTNVIGLVVINGVYLLFLSIDLGDRYGTIIKVSFSALLLFLISFTDCRSVYFGFAVFIIIRYIIFNQKNITKTRYVTISTLLMTIPYIIMQIYFAIFKSSNVDEINRITLELTEKPMFTGREEVWDNILKNNLKGIKLFFGNGIRHANPHNIYMDVLYSYGIIGIILFALVLLYTIHALYKHWKDPVIKTCLACFYGMLAMQSFETVSFGIATDTYNNILYLFLAIAIGRYIYNEKKEYLINKFKQENM